MKEDKLTVGQARELIAGSPAPEVLAELRKDERKGIQKLIASYDRRQEKLAMKRAAFEQRLKLERACWEAGLDNVGGIDEVGRGPLAGPVVACCVILPHDFDLIDVNDSKQLTAEKREKLYGMILERAVDVSIGCVDSGTIDEINIYEAARVAMKQAVESLHVRPDQLLIDAMQIDTDIPQEKLIKGDAKSASISAASIVAKVNRDHLMQFYDRLYPGYGFARNDGYGTREHLDGLEKLGPCPIHRMTFEPLKSKFGERN